MKKYLIAGAALVAIAAVAGPIKVWSNGEILSSSDLNAALSHLHASVGHGHGPVIVNADISASAGIAQSKIAFSVPPIKAFLTVGTPGSPCTAAGTCTLFDTSTSALGTATVTRGATAGLYTLAWVTPLTDNNYTVLTSSLTGFAGFAGCSITGHSTTGVSLQCYTISTATPPVNAVADMVVSIVIQDAN